jgi:hypothetical protein
MERRWSLKAMKSQLRRPRTRGRTGCRTSAGSDFRDGVIVQRYHKEWRYGKASKEEWVYRNEGGVMLVPSPRQGVSSGIEAILERCHRHLHRCGPVRGFEHGSKTLQILRLQQ